MNKIPAELMHEASCLTLTEDAPGTAALFTDNVFAHGETELRYKLFVPALDDTQPAPLLLMLHGCSQDAQDFAIGTQMNTVAQASGMYVLYPSQSATANANKCWNWFEPAHQQRDSGEPERLSALTRQIMDTHPIDSKRVFVAGLSAGGSMALVLAEQYPELYSAVGVHSGLPTGTASSVMDAFRLMQNASATDPESSTDSITTQAESNKQTIRPIPLIVFHGSHDLTVNCANAERIIGNWLKLQESEDKSSNWQALTSTQTTETGHQSIITTYVAEHQPDRAACEYWQLIKGGHTWSGGSSSGSYTNANGPDASTEMVRFFLNSGSA